MSGPLRGLRIIELGESLATAYAGKLLADLGADVVKIERPLTGDPSRHTGPFPNDCPHPERSGVFMYLNTNKRSVTLDIMSASGVDLLYRLAADVDALVSSVHPEIATSAGLTAESFHRFNPELIFASVSPFGSYGPLASYKGYDANIAAFGGICGYLGSPGRPLLVPPLSLGEYQSGLNVAIPVLVSVVADLGGQSIDISQADCWATIQNGMGVIEYIFGGRVFSRTGRGVNSGPYPNTILRCKDGLMRLVAMQRLEWERFLGVMGDPPWAQDPRFRDRVKMNELYSEELDNLIEDWMKDRTRAEIFDACLDAGVPFAPVWTVDELVSQPDFADWFVRVDHGMLSDVLQVGFPYEFSESSLALRCGAPCLGEHTAEMLDTLGVDGEAIVRLRAAGIV